MSVLWPELGVQVLNLVFIKVRQSDGNCIATGDSHCLADKCMCMTYVMCHVMSFEQRILVRY